MKRFTILVALAITATLASALVAGASTRALSGRIVADGSSTVGPFTQAAAEAFMR